MSNGSEPSKRAELIARDGAVCGYCLKPLPEWALTIDHRTPRCRGGRNEMRNFILACRQCNGLKGPLTEEEYRSVMKDSAARKALSVAINARLGNGRIGPDGLHVVPRSERPRLTWRPFEDLMQLAGPLPVC